MNMSIRSGWPVALLAMLVATLLARYRVRRVAAFPAGAPASMARTED